MTATMPTSTNDSPRKNLASQLDRLDGILDGLADGLNDAVASAVKQAVAVAVQEAVRGILTEVLTHTDLLAKLRTNLGLTTSVDNTPAPPATPVKRPSSVAKITGTIAAWFGAGWRSVRRVCRAVTGTIGNALSMAKHRWQLVRQFRVPLLTAITVGVVAGVGAYCGGPYVAAFAGWLAGFTTTLTVQAGLWLRGTLGAVATDGV